MILTIRTDKPEAEIGLFDGGKKLSYEVWLAHRKLAETIHLKIQKLLDDQGKAPSDLKGIVVYEGPGSFTGLRIGVSVANGFAYGLGVPVAAATGQDWVARGIEHLKDRQPSQSVVPVYGSPAQTTTPRK